MSPRITNIPDSFQLLVKQGRVMASNSVTTPGASSIQSTSARTMSLLSDSPTPGAWKSVSGCTDVLSLFSMSPNPGKQRMTT